LKFKQYEIEFNIKISKERSQSVNLRKIAIILLTFSVLLSFFSLPEVFGQEKKKEEEEEVLYIPEEVRLVMEESLVTRQPSLDIPFEIVRFLYLPAQQNVHAVFLFKIKNADLDFTEPFLEKREAGKEEEIQQKEPQFKEISFKVFVQFYERKS